MGELLKNQDFDNIVRFFNRNARASVALENSILKFLEINEKNNYFNQSILQKRLSKEYWSLIKKK